MNILYLVCTILLVKQLVAFEVSVQIKLVANFKLKPLAFQHLMATDLKYEDVLENTEATTVDLSKILNISNDETGTNGRQQRLVFLNKVQQNEKFLKQNIKKFTHLSARWLTVGGFAVSMDRQ